jgi:pyruvate/2-oxoglutarate dehydrogenase complex dihydrolipoamide acyltransferase (E2) component
VRASEGDDVPVGGLIAMIVESQDDIEEAITATDAAMPGEHQPETDAAEAETPPATAAATRVSEPLPPSRTPVTGRVLASPKARRVAAERGIDLLQLRALGVPEPFHVADLDKARTGGGQSSVSAEVDGGALDGLLRRSENADRTMLLAAFAAGALRALYQAPSVSIAIRGIDGSVAVAANPDRGGVGDAEAPALSLVDLCDSRVSAYTSAGNGMTLCVAHRVGHYALTMSFSEAQMTMPHAVALLDDIAARIEDPIRQLL